MVKKLTPAAAAAALAAHRDSPYGKTLAANTASADPGPDGAGPFLPPGPADAEDDPPLTEEEARTLQADSVAAIADHLAQAAQGLAQLGAFFAELRPLIPLAIGEIMKAKANARQNQGGG